MLSTEEVVQELSKAASIEDFYGKDGNFTKPFSKTIEEMLEVELNSFSLVSQPSNYPALPTPLNQQSSG
jgi:hypothetical protein